MAQDSSFDLLKVDDFYFSALLDEDQGDITAISDEKYAQELQLQETLISSVISSQKTNNGSSPPTAILCLPSSSSSSSSPPPTPTLCWPSKPLDAGPVPDTKQTESTNEAGESSVVICEICAETKGSDQMFRNQRCHHSFCSDCVTKQVATKIQESITAVSCPGLDCKDVIELDACRSMLPKDLLDRWDEALCEALFLAAPKFYCPFRDCSAMLLDDNEGEIISESECPDCHRLFCARCYVPWHPGVECEVFQNLNQDERGREDLLVRELAKEKEWGRCPQCKFYVEKTEGCLHITCRCQFQFCYRCGEQWTSAHGGCQGN